MTINLDSGSFDYVPSRNGWRLRVPDGRNDDGKPRLKAFYTAGPAPKNKGDNPPRNVVTILRQKEAEWREQAPEFDRKRTIEVAAREWYKERGNHVRAEGENADEINERENRYLDQSTYDHDQVTLNAILRTWGKVPESEFTAAMFDDDIHKITCMRAKRKGKGFTLVDTGELIKLNMKQKIRTTMNMIFRREIKRGYIKAADNPMLLIEELHDTSPASDVIDAYTMEELDIIRKYVKPNSPNIWDHALVVAIAGEYRREEELALLASDIEPDGSVIDINKVVKLKKGGIPYLSSYAKTKGSKTITALPEYAWTHAKWLRDHADPQTGIVFVSPKTGDRYVPSAYSDNIRKAMKRCGVRVLQQRCLRDTGATIGKTEAGLTEDEGMIMSRHTSRRVYKKYSGHEHLDVKTRLAAKINEAVTKYDESQRVPKKDEAK